ncbi:uncharacterized protein AC631_04794 [Debaryomyces fabryi]|uniref:Sulfite efflux pump SSU1 n=1 Tax=Debaryomyces fabryi TaxID=58627 RepID=A0A0V1PTZ1_9ASCO|nr:uncharacterized protein AC631_04794 [Debaryomyces fabryi]KRZ99454.1 hypothetical protein AC631_04794 [Debaryomyces fabryi]CUM46507.1 unnamed protein product [Debaryomyces fabryi]
MLSSNATGETHQSSEREKDLEIYVRDLKGSIIGRLCYEVDQKLIKGFTPAYFGTIMGIGVSSCVLYKFPYPSRWLEICGCIIFGVGVAFFLVIIICFVAFVLRYPKKFAAYTCDPAIAPFMGGLPMGFNTLINFVYYLTGKEWIIGVWVLWWMSVILALYTGCVVFYAAFIAKKESSSNYLNPKDINAALLMPNVAFTVSASTGNLLVVDLPSLNLQIITMIVSYILWSSGIILTFIILSIYYWKLFVHKIPATNLVFTSFLPAGAVGQGAFCINLFGNNMNNLIVQHHTTILSSHYLHFPGELDLSSVDTLGVGISIGQVALLMTAMMCLSLISFGFFSTYIAIISSISKIRPFTKNYNLDHTYKPSTLNSFTNLFTGFIKFNKSYWAMTFPLGTMAISCNELSKSFGGLKTLQVIATIYAVALLIVTIGCIFGVMYKIGYFANYALYGTNYEKF